MFRSIDTKNENQLRYSSTTYTTFAMTDARDDDSRERCQIFLENAYVMKMHTDDPSRPVRARRQRERRERRYAM